MSDESLGSILSDDEAPEEEVTEKSAPPQEASNAGETPAAKLDATESETDEIDTEEPDELGDLRYSGLKKAARKERKIRRAAEKQSKDLQRQIDQLNAHMQVRQQYQPQQHQQPAVPVPPKEDDRFDRLLGKDGFKVIEELVEERFSARDNAAKAMEERQISARAYASRQKLLSEDPGAAEDLDVVFRQLAQQDPRLERQALASEDPARWAVQYAREVKRIQQYGSIDELVEAEIAKRAAAQSSESIAPEVQVRPQHKTIAGVRGSGSGSRRPSSDQDSLRDILS